MTTTTGRQQITDPQLHDFYAYREHLHAAAVALVNRWNTLQHLFSVCGYQRPTNDRYAHRDPLWFIEATAILKALGDPTAGTCHICVGDRTHA